MASSGRSGRWWRGALALGGVLVLAWCLVGSERAPEFAPAASDALGPERVDSGVTPARAIARALTAPHVDVAPVATSAVFEGDVVDDEGKGVPGAELVFEYQGAAATEHADGKGHFVFHAEPPGRWTLGMISAPGFRSFAPEWGKSTTVLEAVRGGRVDGLRFERPKVHPFHGRVVDSDDHAIAGAQIIAIPRYEAPHGEDQTTSDAHGGFTLPVWGPSVRLSVRHAGYELSFADYGSAAGTDAPVTIRLKAAGPRPPEEAAAFLIHGAVVDVQGNGIRADVGAVPDSQRGVAFATAEDGGEFTLGVAADGGWQLTAFCDGFDDSTVHVEVPVRDRVVLVLRPQPALVTVSGQVTDAAGRPVTAFRVSATNHSSARLGAGGDVMEVFSSDGRFSIPGVLPGSVSITAYAEGFVHEYVGPFAVGVHGVEDVRVVLHRGGRIVGTVVAEDDGHPIEAATVRLGPGGTFVQTGADGSFALASVPAGVHGLFVSAHLDDYVSREVPGIDVPEAGKVGPLRISLRAVDPRAPEKSDYEGIGMRCADWELDGDGYRVSEVHPKGGAHVAGI
jgi:hypothetical protein